MRRLTNRQQAFCREYIVDLNATQAAIRAGYSERTARSQGQRLLTNVDIEECLQELITERSERVQITADAVLTGISSIAFDESVKPNDRLKAYDLLGKHLGLFVERREIATTPRTLDDMSDDELIALIGDDDDD